MAMASGDVSSTLAKVGQPDAPMGANREVLGKLGHRVAQYMLEYRCNDEPEHIAPNLVGVSPNNRAGADPNLQVVHNRIVKSFHIDGHDPSRHPPGIVVRCTSGPAKAALVDYNLRFSEGRPLLPSVDKEGMTYATLAGSHLTLAVKCVKDNMQSPHLLTQLGQLAKDDEKLRNVVNKGLKYWILKEDTPVDAQREISQWRSQDQNSSQAFHEIELVHALSLATKKEALRNPRVVLANVCAIVTSKAPVALAPLGVSAVGRYVIGFYSANMGRLVHELCQFHSAHVDPQQLSVGHTFFEAVCKAANLGDAHWVRYFLVRAMYTTDSVLPRQRPQPDQCSLFSSGEVDTFAGSKDFVTRVEGYLSSAHALYLPHLERHMTKNVASDFLGELGCAIVRVALGKSCRSLAFLLGTCRRDSEAAASLKRGILCS